MATEREKIKLSITDNFWSWTL